MKYYRFHQKLLAAVSLAWLLFVVNLIFPGQVSISTVQANSPEVVNSCPAGMTAHWKFDEVGGLTQRLDFFDDHDAQCNIADKCPTPTTGIVNGAQLFGGDTAQDELFIYNTADFDWATNDNFSIELWMKGIPGQTCAANTGNFLDNEVFIGRFETGKTQWWLGCDRNTKGAVFKVEDVNGLSREIVGPAIDDGTWHYLVGVRDADSNQVLLYVDGALAGSMDDPGFAGFSSSSPVNIGFFNGEFYFNGTLDEIAVSNTALSASEVAGRYNGGQPKNGLCYPKITSVPSSTAPVDQTFQYQLTVAGAQVQQYSKESPTPPEATIDPNSGLLTWTPDTINTYQFSLKATNPLGEDTQTFNVVIEMGTELFLPLVYK